MPWTGDSGRTYELALLDTNVLSEIVKNPESEGRGFINLLDSKPIAPCFTPYNVAELYRAQEVYQGFVEVFSFVPIFLTVPWEMLLEREVEHFDGGPEVSPLLNAFTPNGPDPSFDLEGTLESVFMDPETQAVISSNDPDVAAMEVTSSLKVSQPMR